MAQNLLAERPQRGHMYITAGRPAEGKYLRHLPSLGRTATIMLIRLLDA